MKPGETQLARIPSRAPASAPKPARRKIVKVAEQGDPDVNLVLERLRRAHDDNSAISRAPASSRAAGPAPEPVVPDPVYDYSQNF